jgi:hypothetical protein
MGLRVDHVVFAAGDLDEAARRMRERFGLGSVPGGRHPGWGTANRIIPLGPDYLELMALVDPEEAARDPVGRALARRLAEDGGPALWCVATDDLDAAASRLGLAVQAKSRVLPDGSRVAWRSAGLDRALERPWLPFFIAWEIPPDRHPGRMRADHRASPGGIAWVSLGADPGELGEWLGGDRLPVQFAGPPGVNAVGIAAADGVIVLPWPRGRGPAVHRAMRGEPPSRAGPGPVASPAGCAAPPGGGR